MAKRQKKESLILGALLKKIAPRIGACVVIEPEWGIAGQITFKSGKKSYFRYNTVDVNPMGAAEIAEDKDYANFFMQKMGYPVVPGGKTFFSDEWADAVGVPKRTKDAAYAYAKKRGFPVVVKPNSGSQGKDVAIVSTKAALYRALHAVFKNDRVAIVQDVVSGKDYRLVVLDGTIISAYERVPLSVVGDGRSSILGLLKKKQAVFDRQKRDTRIKSADPRIKEKLREQGMTLGSVPKKGAQVYLLDNANLSTGGDAVDVTGRVHASYAKMAVALTRDMGLRLCGVDIMVDGSIEAPAKYWILEINSSPGLDHYAKVGKAQEKIVEDLYLQVLKSMDR